MCNLNIFVGKNIRAENVVNVSANSYATNSHGDGIYTNYNNKIVKDAFKVNYLKLLKEIKCSNFIISHQRLATSGKTDAETAHPFRINTRFILAHNGVLHGLAEAGKSDTQILCEKLEKAGLTEEAEETDIVKVIKKVMKKVSGSWSITIYDNKEQELYYFKDYYTTINCYDLHDYLYLTTNNTNHELLTENAERQIKEIKILDGKIYKIGKDAQLRIVGKIRDKSGGGYSRYRGWSYGGYGRGSEEFENYVDKKMENMKGMESKAEIKKELSAEDEEKIKEILAEEREALNAYV